MSSIPPSNFTVGPPGLTEAILDSMNGEQQRAENRQALDDLGGIDKLIELAGVNVETGLTKEQVEAHRAKFGPNVFPEAAQDSYLSLLVDALSSSTELILISAATVSTIVNTLTDPAQGWVDGTAIFVAVFLVANIGAANDYAKQRQFRKLEESSQESDRCSVMRDGVIERIHPRDVVVGDILVLQAGEMVPADAVMLDVRPILSNESSLTGEPDDLKKSRDKDCFLLSSCLITEGEDSKAIAIGVGVRSQWGKIKANLVSESVNTPLQDKLEDMATFIGKIGLGFAVATFIALIISIWARDNGRNAISSIIDAFIIAVTIVVVSIPEGLPLAVTISLAYSTQKIQADMCLIRVLAACETMGNATTICSDKTGTLTENRMTVVEGVFGDTIYSQDEFVDCKNMHAEVRRTLAEHIALNRNAYLIWKDASGRHLDRPIIVGNKTEGALILMIQRWGFDYETLHRELYHASTDRVFSFNSAKKRSTCVHVRPDGTVRLFCKGASEWVIRDCTHVLDAQGKAVPLTAAKKQQLEAHILHMANNALRTLVLAHRDFSSQQALPSDWEQTPPDHADLVLDCIVGIIDPLRGDVKDAVRIAQEAGVTVRMVTGDNLATACAIARQCGILTADGLSVEGPSFRKMTPADVDAMLPRLQVVARSSPDDKYLLVTRLNGHGLPDSKAAWEEKHRLRVQAGEVSWEKDRELILPGYREEWEEARSKEGGQVVGVTGDGTNDAPALKAADVGLAMGITGTKVAQSAADVIIMDDRFSSIVKAISWGRCVFDNIRKFLQFQLTVNVVALLLVFIGALAGFEPPLNAVQLLWVNLIMDTMGALALGTEMPTPELLQRKPYQRSASLISRPMWRNIMCQAAFQLTLLLILLFTGAQLFGVPENATSCFRFASKSHGSAGSSSWDLSTGAKGEGGVFGCREYRNFCGNEGTSCLDATHTISYDNGVTTQDFVFSRLDDFENTCLVCREFDVRHYTIIFNAFIFCQVFNEYTARSLLDHMDVFSTALSNSVFLGVTVFTIGAQILLVEVGGTFLQTYPLSVTQWLVTVALGFIGVPVGFLMRLIPVTEDPASFFDNSNTSSGQEHHKAYEKVQDDEDRVAKLQANDLEENDAYDDVARAKKVAIAVKSAS